MEKQNTQVSPEIQRLVKEGNETRKRITKTESKTETTKDSQKEESTTTSTTEQKTKENE